MKDLRALLYETIHRNKKPVKQIAEEMAISENSLYRYCLPDESGSDIPLKRLIPLMNATQNYSILKHIAKICGFVVVKVPNVAAGRRGDVEMVSDYQHATSLAVKKLVDFFSTPTQEKLKEIETALMDVIEKSASARKYVNKHYSGQLDIFGE